ncbi:hypothetical protein KRR38_01625 [Novosphingobium sp. G106]|uniref:hypothetical protein n=1 Tax=Novosphingobium sp. G106 TaxID=2849500 RepID=UPI001C2D5EE4|nr:hypothetical protein [Novosphingobium sp. G106]MBV1686403.1 hypothetical protein [Novosphingobium sp. G106]
MNADYMAAFRSLPVGNRSKLEAALLEVLSSLSNSAPQPVKTVRDKFSAYNNAAKQGHAQLVRSDPGEETVLLSIKDLATMLQSAASAVSLDDALQASGFRAVPGRLEVSESHPRDTLVEIR